MITLNKQTMSKLLLIYQKDLSKRVDETLEYEPECVVSQYWLH